MKIECPKCHNALECESKWCGQKAQCPYCSSTFIITEIMLEPVAYRGGSKWLRALSAVLCIAAGVGLGHLLFAPGGKAVSPPTSAPKTAIAGAETEKSDVVEAVAAAVAAVPSAAVADATPDTKTEKSDAAAENDTDASGASEKSSDEATVGAEDENYTYEYYEGVYVPYYRGYYYIGGAWVWHGHGRAPFPPPRVRPILRTAPIPVKSAAAKAAPAKAVRSSSTAPAKAAPAKAVRSSSASAKSTRVKRVPARSTTHHGGVRASAPRGPRR